MKTCQLLDPERDKGELFGFGDVRAYRKRCERGAHRFLRIVAALFGHLNVDQRGEIVR